MTKGHTWHMDPDLASIVQDFARDCGRPFEECAAICLLNGLSYTMAMALNRGASTNVELYHRVNAASDALKTDAPHEVHYTHPAVGQS